VIINLYAAIIAAIYIYVLYAFIDPGLVDKALAFAQEKMIAKGIPESAIDSATAIQAKMMKPWLQALSSIFYGVFFGLLISLIISLFVMKKGNPLLDEAEDEPKQ
jgi:Na+/H+ antiporter NhaC